MKMLINKQLNVGYIQIKKIQIAKTIKFKRSLLIDISKKGDVVGIELLDVTSVPKARKRR